MLQRIAVVIQGLSYPHFSRRFGAAAPRAFVQRGSDRRGFQLCVVS